MEVNAILQACGSSDNHWPAAKPFMLDDFAGSIVFSKASPKGQSRLSHVLSGICWETQKSFLWLHMEELEYLCNLIGLQVQPHATSSDKDTGRTQNQSGRIRRELLSVATTCRTIPSLRLSYTNNSLDLAIHFTGWSLLANTHHGVTVGEC